MSTFAIVTLVLVGCALLLGGLCLVVTGLEREYRTGIVRFGAGVVVFICGIAVLVYAITSEESDRDRASDACTAAGGVQVMETKYDRICIDAQPVDLR